MGRCVDVFFMFSVSLENCTFCCLKVTLNPFRRKSFFASCPTLLLLSPSSVKTVGLFPRHCLTCELAKAHCMYFDAVISPANQHIILHCKGRPTGVLICSLVTSAAALITFSCLSLTFAAFDFLLYIFGWLFHLLNIQKVFSKGEANYLSAIFDWTNEICCCATLAVTVTEGKKEKKIYIYIHRCWLQVVFLSVDFFSSRKLNFNLLARVLSQTGGGIVADWRLLVSSHLSGEGSGGEESLNVIKQEEQDRKWLQRAAILFSFPAPRFGSQSLSDIGAI